MTHSFSVKASDFPVAKVTVFRADSAEVTRYLSLELKVRLAFLLCTEFPYLLTPGRDERG